MIWRYDVNLLQDREMFLRDEGVKNWNMGRETMRALWGISCPSLRIINTFILHILPSDE